MTTETRYQRIAREQRERQHARAKRAEAVYRNQRAATLSRRKERRHNEAMEREAEYMPDSFDPPDPPQH